MVHDEDNELARLRARMADAEAALEALSRGDADALVGPRGVVSLRGAEKPYQTFFQAMNEGGVTLDASGRVLYCNPRFAAMADRSVDQLRGCKLVELIAMNDRLRVLRLLASQMTSTSEASLLSPRGTQHPVLLSLTAFDAGGMRLTCVVVTDLRERVAAMAALQASETKFRLMAESVADCIFWVGADERFKYLSPACQRLSGYAPEEFLADPGLMLRIIHPDDRARYLAHIEHDLADACETEYRIVRRDGELRWIGHYCRPIRGKDGRDLGRRGTNRDITDRKELEQQVRRLRRAVEQSRESVVVSDRASPEIRSLSTLVLALVHRLRAAFAPQQGLPLDAIEGAGARLGAIVEDLLDLARIEAGCRQLESSDFAVAAIFDDVASIIGTAARVKDLPIGLDYRGVPAWLRGDPTRLRQALLNYADNAVKFTEKGSITLVASVLEDSGGDLLVRFAVADTGVGITHAGLAGLFRACGPADAPMTGECCGTGLGLAITQRIARLMGGEVGADSSPGQGSTFWFTARLQRGHGAVSR